LQHRVDRGAVVNFIKICNDLLKIVV
jgi:hypothetical protein